MGTATVVVLDEFSGNTLALRSFIGGCAVLFACALLMAVLRSNGAARRYVFLSVVFVVMIVSVILATAAFQEQVSTKNYIQGMIHA